MPVRRAAATAPDLDDYLGDEDVDTSVDDLFEQENEDEVPARSSVVQAGWGSAKNAIRNSGKFTIDFKPTEDAQLVRFLEGEPIAVYKQHWLKEKEGRKSYTCLGTQCPLCNIAGHSPDQKIAFTILNLSTEEPEVQLMSVGPRLAGQLEKLHGDKKTGPLDTDGRYWSIARSGKGTSTSYAVLPIKDRDLAEDWDVSPTEVAAAVAAAKPLDISAVRLDTYDELLEIARDLAA